MQKKAALFNLIKAMSKAEKRFFRASYKTSESSKNFMKLFDAIDKQDAYDEKQLKQQFANHRFIKQLHVTKIYLNAQILKSLRAFHSKSSKENEIKSLLQNLEILQKKELYPQCLVLIEQGLKLARRFEKWPDSLNLLAIKREILRNQKGTHAALEQLQEISRQEKEILGKFTRVSELWALTVDTFSNFGNNAETQNHPLLANVESQDSFQAELLYCYNWQALHYGQNNVPGARQMMERVIFIWEENEHQIRENPGAYLTALNNLLGIALQERRYEYAEQLLFKTRRLPKRFGLKGNSPIAVKAMLQSYNVELEMYRDTGRTDRALALIPIITAYLDEPSRTIPDAYALLLNFQIASVFYLEKVWQKALHYLNIILSTKFGEARKDIKSYAHLMFLIIHFELGHVVMLRYAVESSRRFLKKKGAFQNFEKQLLAAFSKLSTVPKTEYKKVFEDLNTRLFYGLSAGQKNHILDYLDFQAWIDTNLSRREPDYFSTAKS